jgi:hypothetical protein
MGFDAPNSLSGDDLVQKPRQFSLRFFAVHDASLLA